MPDALRAVRKGIERGVGLLDDALALDLRRPQDYFNRVWSTAFRATDLATRNADGEQAVDEQKLLVDLVLVGVLVFINAVFACTEIALISPRQGAVQTGVAVRRQGRIAQVRSDQFQRWGRSRLLCVGG